MQRAEPKVAKVQPNTREPKNIVKLKRTLTCTGKLTSVAAQGVRRVLRFRLLAYRLLYLRSRRYSRQPRPAWALDQSECMMAKRTKRATARKAKAPKRASKKVAKKAKPLKKQAAKRPLKTKAKRQRKSTKSGRPAAKKSALRRRRTPTQQGTPQLEMMMVETPQTETTIVDVIEEPVPGVFVVTEFVEPNAEPEPTDSLDIDQIVGPESEEK